MQSLSHPSGDRLNDAPEIPSSNPDLVLDSALEKGAAQALLTHIRALETTNPGKFFEAIIDLTAAVNSVNPSQAIEKVEEKYLAN